MAEDAETGTVRRAETMGGLAKGLAILEIFGAGATRLTVADAARGADMSRAAARRCLLTLEELGYVGFDGKFFSPRPRLHRLGGQPVVGASLAQRAQPILADVCELLDEPISLAVLDGREALFIARAEASHIVSTGVRLGGRLPAYCSATGRILLGSLDDDEVRTYLATTALVARTARTVTDPAALFALVVETRRTGISVTDEELEVGMRSMAVQVRGATGETIAALSVSTLAGRVSLDHMWQVYRPALERSAARLTASLAAGNATP